MRPREPSQRLERRLKELVGAIADLTQGRVAMGDPAKTEAALIAALRDVEFLLDVFRHHPT